MKQAQKHTSLLKWVQHTPVGQLKALTGTRLQEIRDSLFKDMREIRRALQWVEGIIKLKAIEKDKAETQAEDRS
ncbi:MAG: hypothetical protein WCY57_01295 [Micavibrio sp.]